VGPDILYLVLLTDLYHTKVEEIAISPGGHVILLCHIQRTQPTKQRSIPDSDSDIRSTATPSPRLCLTGYSAKQKE
jgi:hypothetical protein